MKTLYCHVIDDGGFAFGMDPVTPVMWEFSSRPRKRSYITFVIHDPSGRQIDYAQHPRIVSLQDMCATMRTLA